MVLGPSLKVDYQSPLRQVHLVSSIRACHLLICQQWISGVKGCTFLGQGTPSDFGGRGGKPAAAFYLLMTTSGCVPSWAVPTGLMNSGTSS